MSDVATKPTVCPYCNKKYKLPASAVGKKARCKACGKTFVVESIEDKAPEERIRVACGCGKTLRVPATAAGRRVKCPKCQAKLRIPAAAPVGAGDDLLTPPPDLNESDDPFGDDLLGGLDGGEAIERESTEQPMMTCGRCGETTPAGPICRSCGADPVSYGVETNANEERADSNFAAGFSGATARLAVGTAAAVVAGIVGGGIWFAIHHYAGAEIGFVAWGIGALVGFAMAVGSREDGFLQGAISSGVAALAIVGGKVAAFAVVVGPMLALIAQMADASTPREALAKDRAYHFLDYESDDPQQAFAEAYKLADAEVAKLDDEEFWSHFREFLIEDLALIDAHEAVDVDAHEDYESYEAEVDRITGNKMMIYEESLAEASPEEMERKWKNAHANDSFDEAQQTAIMHAGFFQTMFDWHDVFFLGFATLIAFKIGSDGSNVLS